MANDGKITLKDLVTDEALRFGYIYAENLKVAIQANEELKNSSKELNKVMGLYRNAESNSKLIEVKNLEKNAIDKMVEAMRNEQIALQKLDEERQKAISMEKLIAEVQKARQKTAGASKKAIDEERLSHTKLTNSLKQEEQFEKSLERTKRERIETEKKTLELSAKMITQQGEEIKLLSQSEDLEKRKLATEKEEVKLLQELERLEQRRLITSREEVAKLQQEERLKKTRLDTIRAEKAALLDEQRIIKSSLDIKSQELRIAAQEEAAKKRNTVLTAEERVQNEMLNRAKKQQAREVLGLVGPYEKLRRERNEAQKRLADLLSAEHKNTQEIKAAQREYDKLAAKVKEVNRATEIYKDNIGNYESAFSGLAGMLEPLVAAFGIATGISLFSDAVRGAVAVIKDYEAEIVNLAAIAGHTREEIAPLEEEIQNVAKASINSATDVAKLATELIKLGSTPEEAMKLLKPVNDLSLALRASAEEAATLVKSLLNAYGEGAQEAARYTDVLAEAANRSALDFQGLRDAFSYIAPTARTVGFSLEKTAAILGILADNGIKAESAGRLTSTAMIRLSQSGLTLEEALTKLNDAQRQGKDELELLSLAGGLFGAEAAKIGIILANNQDKIEKNTVAYQNSKGALEDLTNKQLKSLDAQLKILDSSLEDYILNLNESTGFSEKLASAAKFLAENLDIIIDVALKAGAAFVIYKAAVIANSIATRIAVIANNAMAVSTAFVSRGLAGARAEMQALNIASRANPFGLIVVAAAALIYVISSLNKNIKELNAETKSNTEEVLKNRDTLEANGKSISKMADRYEELAGKINRNAKEQKEMNELTEALSKIAPEAIEKVNKYGEVVELNTAKLREYVNLQKEQANLQTTIAIQKELELLKELKEQRAEFNGLEKEGNNVNIEGVGIIKRKNGLLVSAAGYSDNLKKLNVEDLAIVRLQVSQNKSLIIETEARINSLKRLQTQATATNAATSGGTPTDTAPIERTIAVINAEIQAERDKIDALSFATRAQGVEIKKRIAALEKEKEAIFSTEKAIKKAKKTREEELAAMRKINDDAYNLSVFRLNRVKQINDDIVADDNATFEERTNAAIKSQEYALALNEEALEKQLKDISRYNDKVRDLSNKEIERLVTSIQIPADLREKLNNEEILALEKYYAEKENIYKKSEASIDDLVSGNFEKNLNAELQMRENALNEALIAENDRFNNERTNERNREKAVERHESNIAKIKKAYAIQAVQEQIKAFEALLAAEALTAEQRKDAEAKLSDFRRELSDLQVKTFEDNSSKEVKTFEDQVEQIKDLAGQLKDALGEFANALFDARIQKIDDEIAAQEEYYGRQIELAGNDAAQRELIEKEQEKKRQALEKKKREEQRKQAIFNKALKIVDIGIATAQGIMQAYAQTGPIAGSVFAALIAALGAVQLATVLATPIPKYRHGRKGGPAEIAYVGDGGVSEVIEKKDGSIRLTPSKATLTMLDKGDSVHSSHDAYMRYMRGRILSGVTDEHNRIKNFNHDADASRDNGRLKETIKDAIKDGFKTAKINNNIIMPKIDIEHAIWALKNKNWN